jgi:hypothetical protein
MGWTAGHLQETTNPTSQSLEQQLLCEQYRVASEPFWQLSQACGHDGYERMNAARAHGWTAIPSWGLEGWDLGRWPLVIIFHRHGADAPPRR